MYDIRQKTFPASILLRLQATGFNYTEKPGIIFYLKMRGGCCGLNLAFLGQETARVRSVPGRGIKTGVWKKRFVIY